MDEPTCVTCPWWSRFPERVEYRWSSSEDAQVEVRTPNEKGECRKAPPRPPREFPVTGPGRLVRRAPRAPVGRRRRLTSAGRRR